MILSYNDIFDEKEAEAEDGKLNFLLLSIPIINTTVDEVMHQLQKQIA